MKRKIPKILSVSLALVLALSLSLVMAVPVAAEPIPGEPIPGAQLSVSDPLAVAEWTTLRARAGSYSVHLDTTAGSQNSGIEARIRIEMAEGTTLGDIVSVSWWRYIEDGFAPHLDIILDLNEDGSWTAADDDALVIQYAYNPVGHLVNGVANFYGAQQDAWAQTFSDTGDPTGPAEITDTTTGWATTGAPGAGSNFFEHTLAEWKTGVTYTADGYASKTIDGASVVLALEIEADHWYAGMDVYIDEIVINGTPYELEPPSPFDEEFYAVGDVPIVTIYDGAANDDPMVIEGITVEVKSSTDTIGDLAVVLTETAADSAVFVGSFTLLGAAPADRAADQIVVSEGDTITLTYPVTPDWVVTALVDEAPPTIEEELIVEGVTVTPTVGAIIYHTTPLIVATYSDATSEIDTTSVTMTVNSVAVTPSLVTASQVSYTPSTDLPVGSTVEVTVNVSDNAGNSATASWSFSIAGKFNVSVTSATTIPAAVAGDVIVTFKDAQNAGIKTSPGLNELASVQVTLSGVGVDMDSGVLVAPDLDTHTFSNVWPEQAGEITVTFVGTFDSGVETVETKTLTIDVTGYLVEETWADVGMNTTGDISLRVTTKAGAAVNTGTVIITAAEADGFAKDVDPLVAGDESFKVIVINGAAGVITYDGGDAEDFLVSDGNYEVTGITFANIGAVDILVEDAGGGDKAHFITAFSVLGNNVYSLTFEPATLTAGVDAAGALDITITENDDPAIDVDKIFIGGVEKVFTRADNVYTITAELLYLEAKTGEDALVVMARNALGTEYGTATLEVELPAVIPDTEIMLTGVEYTVVVSVLDASEEALEGFLWIGTYDEETEIFTPDPVIHLGGALLELDAEGTVEFAITVTAEASLVWKVGGSNVMANAALILEPDIAVEDPEYSLAWLPLAPEVGEEITFTVTDNYGDAAASRDIKVVSPGGDLIEKVTTLAGVFKYTPTEDGDFAVYIWGVSDWQAPEIVTVVVTRLVSIAASPLSVPLYVGETQQLAITATYEDASTAEVTATATYASDAVSVATVSIGGLITAVAEGTATITVTYTEGVITRTVDVLVTVTEVPVLVSIAASPLSVSLNPVDTQQLAITATYSDASTAVVTTATYESDAVSVATVSIGGLITAVAEGTAIITVSYTEDAITVTTDVSVTVTVVEPLTIQLWEGANPIYYIGATMALPAALTNISEKTEVIWQRDVSTGGLWEYYFVEWATGDITQLENGRVYIIVVSEDCTWEVSQ